jgi:hypothetical protein
LRRLRVFTIICALLPKTVLAQHVSFGLKGGIPLTQAFENGSVPRFTYTFDTKRYIVGPTAEFRLVHSLGFEVDALYTRLDYDSTAMGVDTFTRSATRANSWEIPLLVKKHFGVTRGLEAYGDTGFAFRHIGGIPHVVTTIFPSHTFEGTSPSPPELIRPWTEGLVIGSGLEFRTGPILLLPEIRYTRWFQESFHAPTGVFISNLNEVDFLLGIGFRRN